MANEHKKLNMGDATHVGNVIDFTKTTYNKSILITKMGPNHRFLIAPLPVEMRGHAHQYVAYLALDEKGNWRIPGTRVSFSAYDGEGMVDGSEKFKPIYLQLKTLRLL